MKSNCFHLWPMLAAGLLISPLCAQGPAGPQDRPTRDAPREAPNPERLKGALAKIMELHQAGKHEEAQKMSQRLREAAKNNPQLARQIGETMKAMRQQRAGTPAPERGGPQPPMRPNARPNMRPGGQPQPPMVRPNAPQQGPKPPVMRPNVPPTTPQPPMANRLGQQRGPQPPAMRPNAPRTMPQPPLAKRGPQSRPGCPGCPGCPLATPGRPMAKDSPAARKQAAQSRPHVAKEKAAKEKAAKEKAAKEKAAKEKVAKQPDTNARLLNEMGKINRQLNDLSTRVKKLETAK